MPRAILITGNSRRHLENNLKMQKHLQNVGIKEIDWMHCAYSKAARAKTRLARLMAKSIETPLLICYSGHGSKFGLAINEDEILFYADLAFLLLHHAYALVVLDCCNAFRLSIELERYCVDMTTTGLIAACDEEEESAHGLIHDVVAHWSRNETYPDQKLVRNRAMAMSDSEDMPRQMQWMVEVTENMMRFPITAFKTLGNEKVWTRKRWGAIWDYSFFYDL